MKKLFVFAMAMLASSTYCQLDSAGLGGRASPTVGDASVHRDTGDLALDGSRPLDGPSFRYDALATDDAYSSGGLASGGVSGSAAGSAGSSLSAGGAVSNGGASSAGGVVAPGGVLSTGGVLAAAGMPGAGGSTMAATGGRDSPDAGTAADVPPSPPDSRGRITPDAAPTSTLVWSDEFGGEANARADTTKWTYVTWPAGQANHEKQEYTNRAANAFLDGTGNLIIRALRPGGNQYTSARLDTNGKFSFRTGRIEVRAKLPAGIGSAPGIVLMGTKGSWPDSGELALMEQGGQDKSWFYATAYAGGASGDTGHVRYDFPNATRASGDFHVYSLNWSSDGVVFQVDGSNVASRSYDSTSPFASIPESIVLYLAVGGDLGGAIDDKAFPMDMVVDYVRVYSY